jgi:AcrR family transcriptional regulator
MEKTVPVTTVGERASHADQVRQRILDGAARAFSRSGRQGTSVPDIATECGISVGLLYRYFESKGELYTAICTSQSASEAGALRLEMDSIRDPQQRLEHAVDFYLERLYQGGGAGLLLGALAEAQSNQLVRDALRVRRDAICEFIEGFLADLASGGELAPGPPISTYVKGIAMLLDGAVVDWAVSGSELDRAAIRRAILDLLSGLFGGPAGQPPSPAEASA